jgi:hypothetical protein
MKKLVPALAPMLLLAACGGAANDITVTNDANVVLNDAQGNYAFRGDDEMTNEMAQNEAAQNAAAGEMMANEAMGGAGNAM